MPQMNDSFFTKTLTYLIRHNEEGALGIVINKPMKVSLEDIFQELDIDYPSEPSSFGQQQVLAGGPVEKDKGFIIHNSSKTWDSSISASLSNSEQISICTSKTILQDIANGEGPEQYLIALGCAGWEAGQLEQEISNNAWLTTPANAAVLFSRDFDAKSAQAAAILGIDLQQLAPTAGHS
ncbi:MAG: YqgE/AlgH family protein [SAR86 cluster bacterium]|uniref:UPF0301 protein COC19_03170 n=1 Tax=SAR86 cluster bacterium TaxID=2030880 RepID=A0A2A4MRJ0_9GAMM|nr:MAG: YqgE/AlgH family protein [SAR86 cluster bacterium]